MIQQLTDPHPRLWTKAEYYKLGELGFFDDQKVELLEGEIWVKYPDPQRSGLPYPSIEPHVRLWTKEEYYKLAELGFFYGQRVELWEGEIVVFSPQGPLHYAVMDDDRNTLERHFGPGYKVRMQGPVDLGLHIEPEPDISVVPDSNYSTAHPHGALLIVEVSDSTLSTDRNQKGSLYARAGIADYWIANLVDDQLEVYRDPQPDASQAYGHRYPTRIILQRGDSVSPLAAPHLTIPVADLLG
jgi:Uma2 family endonuclease